MPYPKSGNPEVTMRDEAMLYPEVGTTDHGFMDWGFMMHLVGEDGTDYFMDTGLAKMKMNATWGAMPFGTEEMDAWHYSFRTTKGKVYTPKGQIFKVADFDGVTTNAVFRPYPGGSMQFDRDDEKNIFTITLDKYVCIVDVNKKTWRQKVFDEQAGIGFDLTHYGDGYPFWYNQAEARTLVDHLKAAGYNWPSRVEGTLTYDGVEHKVKGFGSRERAILPDQSNVEAGGWLDLIMFNFDEMQGLIQEYKMSKDKDASLYIRDTGKYYATVEPRAKVDKNVNFDVTHEDWAWLAPIGCFIPTKFICKMDVGDGVLDFTANICGCKCVALQADVECDVPNVTLDADIVEGTFTYKDGRVIELHNGFFINNIVCWRTYPSWIPNFGPQQGYNEVNPMKG